jgi:hypothetical protein
MIAYTFFPSYGFFLSFQQSGKNGIHGHAPRWFQSRQGGDSSRWGLREVTWFKYLGFIMVPTLLLTAHITRATERAKAAASVITSILKRIRVTNLARLGTYI